MSRGIRWLAPTAIFSAASVQCIAAQYMSLEQAQALIFPNAKEFVAAPVTLTPDQVARIERQSGVSVRSPEQQVWQARADGKLLGWFIVDRVIGKHEASSRTQLVSISKEACDSSRFSSIGKPMAPRSAFPVGAINS